MRKRINRLNRIARKLGREHIWRKDQIEALVDNIDSDLEILKQEILGLKVTWQI